MTEPLPVTPRVLKEMLPLPGSGLAVKPVASWVTAEMMSYWPRSAMVSAGITSTLAGVCRRGRPRRLPVELVPVRLSVGAANTGPVGAALGAAVLVGTSRRRLARAARVVCPALAARRTVGGFA